MATAVTSKSKAEHKSTAQPVDVAHARLLVEQVSTLFGSKGTLVTVPGPFFKAAFYSTPHADVYLFVEKWGTVKDPGLQAGLAVTLEKRTLRLDDVSSYPAAAQVKVRLGIDRMELTMARYDKWVQQDVLATAKHVLSHLWRKPTKPKPKT